MMMMRKTKDDMNGAVHLNPYGSETLCLTAARAAIELYEEVSAFAVVAVVAAAAAVQAAGNADNSAAAA